MNELDDPVAVAVDPFGSVHIAELTGQLQRITSNCPLSSPYFDAVPGVASDAQGNINFSDPQHGIVWRLPAAPPPSRDHLQFRLISADYPTAGQKLQRLTTRHRQLRAATRSRLRTTIRAKHETPLTLKPNLPLPPTTGSVFQV